MSTRLLAFVASVLAVLVAAVVYVGLDRLGYLHPAEAPGWKFKNRLLEVPLGTRVILRPINPKAVKARLWFWKTITEPRVERDRPPQPTDIPALPHVLMGQEMRRPEDRKWIYSHVNYAVLAQLGARTAKEWLEEIRPVREKRSDGSFKILLRARFGHDDGSQIAYFFDPDDPDAARLGFGWIRMEAYGTEQVGEIAYATADGRFLPDEAKEKPG